MAFDKALAFTTAALILFIVANTFPFMGFGLPGDIRHTSLVTGSIEMYQQGAVALSLIVIFAGSAESWLSSQGNSCCDENVTLHGQLEHDGCLSTGDTGINGQAG